MDHVKIARECSGDNCLQKEVNCRFYGRNFCFMATHQRNRKTEFTTIKQTIYLRNDNFQYIYPHPYSNAFFTFFLSKYSVVLPKSSGVSDVKPDVSQWKVTLRNDVGIGVAKSWRHRIRRRVILARILESAIKCRKLHHYVTSPFIGRCLILLCSGSSKSAVWE